jgi:hypothetical protein
MSCERDLAELFFYGELRPAEQASFERHLALCAECRAALDDLAAIRSALAPRTIEAPPGGDWAPFMNRLDAQLRIEPRRAVWRPHALAGLAAAAALIVAVLGAALFLRPQPDLVEPLSVSSSPLDRQRALASAAEQHLGRSKLVLLGLLSKDAEAPDDDWVYEQALALSLLPDTSLYRLAAEEQGLTRLVDVLADLELVLVQASAGDGRDDETLERVQRLIRRRDLMVKMDLLEAQPVAAAGSAT